MSVRSALSNDWDSVDAMLAAYHSAAMVFPFAYDPDSVHALFNVAIVDPSCIALLWSRKPGLEPHGILIGHSAPSPFNRALRVAKEVVLWVDTPYRGHGAATKLVAGFEEWARGRDCGIIGLSAMAAAPGAGALFERAGYKATETNYLKEL